MTTRVEAVYEHGMLRLMEPISLPEGTHVEVTVTTKESVRQDRVPAEILGAIAAMARPSGNEEFSGRDHDKILYGENGAQ